MSVFGRKAVQLVQEIAISDPDQILSYNADVIQQVVQESHEHHQHVVNMLLKVQESGVEWGQAGAADAAAIMVHHQTLLRNKRCMLAYLHHRMARIRRLRWQLGAILPQSIQEKLGNSEKEYFRTYSEILGDYMSAMDIDLTVDLVPPKDPYIEVRVLKDAGSLMMDDKVAYLEQNTVHLVRRADAEPLILKGMLEHKEY